MVLWRQMSANLAHGWSQWRKAGGERMCGGYELMLNAGAVWQGELIKTLAQGWPKRKKMTTVAVYAGHFGASLLMLF